MDEKDASQAYGQCGLAPIASVVDRYPFTTVCWELEVFLSVSLTMEIFAPCWCRFGISIGIEEAQRLMAVFLSIYRVVSVYRDGCS